MSKWIEEGAEFDPTRLESLIVARPLLEMMALQEAQKANPQAFDPDTVLPPLLKVVIDLNFKFVGGLELAKKTVKALLMDRGVTCGAKHGETIHVRKTKLSTQQVFATLHPDTIRYLAAKMREEKIARHGDGKDYEAPIFAIWPDFALTSHIHRTIATVKADATRRSFRALGDDIVWAVVDSGISRNHWHFRRHGNLDLKEFDGAIRHMDFTQDWPDLDDLSEEDARAAMKAEEEVSLTDDYGHGSHVAGIIAGEYITDPDKGWSGRGRPPQANLSFRDRAYVYRRQRTEDDGEDYALSRIGMLSGMAPRTKLVSFRVLDRNGGGDVSNVIAALAQIQIINEHGRYLRIHGVNLSVGYPFNPEWFACGQSPLCVEVDRLVKSGVVVVVSAGNSGYGTKQTLMTRKMRAGMLMTINDPGNARLAITVGATHSEKPHEFGPSYFSSKGPTGDGRLKPDLLAPGERIVSCGAGAQAAGKDSPADRIYVDQTGTSMAAPHVSGAIAAFLSIRKEFIGQPERVKEIFTASATDLGRDRNMQGAGLLDLMRAIQSV